MKRQKNNYTTLMAVFGLIIVGMIGVGIFGWLLYRHEMAPVDRQDQSPIEFVIESGESVDQISQRLQEQDLIRRPIFLKYYLKRNNLGNQIQAGDFVLRRSMSLAQIATALTKASSQQIAITLLEGWRIEQVAEHLATKLNQAGIAFDPGVFMGLPEVKEGYVFPDTYFLALNTTEAVIAKTIEANFNQKIQPLEAQINDSAYTLDQILVMASIVEREARQDRPIVAGILWKRLENDWPLQADATLQYAKGYNAMTNEWWTPPLAIDKEIESAYNTYANLGLPPAPIANPSLDSIQASLSPQTTEYWYYITDLQGRMHYAVTYDQHLANIDRYLR